MSPESPESVTQLLSSAKQGDDAARSRLWKLVYEELHALARKQTGRAAQAGTPQATSLVHEVFVRLTAGEYMKIQNRRHFFAVAARAMRQIRIDDVRRRKRAKRGGDRHEVELGSELPGREQDPSEMLAIHEILGKLECLDSRKAVIVMLRYYAGLTEEQTGDALGISRRTVQLEWRYAKAWLHRELSTGGTTVEGKPRP